jgi:hypothetical protein
MMCLGGLTGKSWPQKGAEFAKNEDRGRRCFFHFARFATSCGYIFLSEFFGDIGRKKSAEVAKNERERYYPYAYFSTSCGYFF